MVCIYCASATSVVNSRPVKRNYGTWRRRQCKSCSALFSTTENIDYKTSFRIDKNGVLEAFSRDILFLSIYDALRYRKTSIEDAGAVTDTVLAQLLAHQTAIFNVRGVKEAAYSVLQRLDSPAAVHYAAFHPLS